MSALLIRYAVRMQCVSGARLINFLKPETNKAHPAHPLLFVFTQKTDKFRLAANGMRTILGQRSKNSDNRPYLHLQIVIK